MTKIPFIAYRSAYAPYDEVYNKKYHEKYDKDVTIIDELVDSSTDLLVTGDILSVDTIYYEGVLQCILKHLTNYPESTAHVVFNAYTRKPGQYMMDFDEATF